MSTWLKRSGLLGALMLAGCSSISNTMDNVGSTVSGWVGTSPNANTLKAADRSSAAPNTLMKYGATLRIQKFDDQRKMSSPNKLGVVTVRVMGMDSGDLLMDQEIASIATASIKKRFDIEGFRILEGSEASKALFEISGVVKELTLNVKERDTIVIGIETTVREVASGKVIWSGFVTEQDSRFAGVSGDSKEDIVNYLNRELRVVSSKTVEAISASLMASRPELFNLTPGTKPIAGVTVYVAPSAPVAAPVMAAPAATGGAVVGAAPVAAPVYVPSATATTGLLLVNTRPARAKVYLDGVYYGLSPLRLEMAPGFHAISVKLDGYKMVTEKVSVRRGDNTEMEMVLER